MTLVASLSNVSRVVGPWLIGNCLRPSISKSDPANSTKAMKCVSTYQRCFARAERRAGPADAIGSGLFKVLSGFVWRRSLPECGGSRHYQMCTGVLEQQLASPPLAARAGASAATAADWPSFLAP